MIQKNPITIIHESSLMTVCKKIADKRTCIEGFRVTSILESLGMANIQKKESIVITIFFMNEIFECRFRDNGDKTLHVSFEYVGDFRRMIKEEELIQIGEEVFLIYYKESGEYELTFNDVRVNQLIIEDSESVNKYDSKAHRNELIKKIEIRSSENKKKQRRVSIMQYIRDPDIADVAIIDANGICGFCGKPFRYHKNDGTPIAHSHHIIWLEHGGLDIIENVIAVCPDCHDYIHEWDSQEHVNMLKDRRIKQLKQCYNQ